MDGRATGSVVDTDAEPEEEEEEEEEVDETGEEVEGEGIVLDESVIEEAVACCVL